MKVQVLTDVASGGAEIHLLVRLEAEAVPARERSPANLALVIDRSSSMRGPRIAQAVAAAARLVEQLGAGDRLAIIAFDASARVLFGPEHVTDEARGRALAALDELRTGVGTNLAAGIKSGAETIGSAFVRGAVSRLILLTDGQPSVGVTGADRLGDLVEKEAGRGVSVTAMGIGVGFDDELLAELARRGRGGFYYLASAADIPAAFGRELDGVFAIAASRTEIKLLPGDEVGSAELLHRLPSRPLEDGLLVEVGEVAAGAPRQVLFRLGRLPGSAGPHCGKLMVSYRDARGAAAGAHIVGIELPSVPITEHAREVTLERLRLAAAHAVDTAWARRASGDRKQALSALGEVESLVRDARDADRADPEALDALLADIAEAAAAVDKSSDERERARRSMRERSHITLLGHSTIARLPSDED